ncbi:MAG: hypothetical protein A2381_06485 [Bdellovibrionales bacterium RIFOXYB1_FULL_37_110]|nr:MAG: hypothetical protein A2181_08505 [Bdellovibrionales bacterium RIFOXYA1_FULL_38_20]OFZ50189.1 MAG: hypothetical protein A2417_19335 [Bdellovibrionales bacterium RIFOXYC1_FULL_37_79]OFZ57626.1 MAG: hypothetical protein A2381_06485 [Bdellovibrionales bacterium RIFOXYB1_FULL_37_110]OFZ61393.1 MAG: hypothetical protein A2577_00850 [Bdellovibrionales bacterium RIFOXYD1_FULL_36_51]
MFIRILGFLLLGQIVCNVYAKDFANQYTSFSLPEGWECGLEGSEWVCQHTNKDRKKEAIIILAAKIRGSQDNITDYMSYLKKVKSFTLPGGKTQYSEPKYTTQKTIHSHPWIDSLHLASEVPGFYTRYMATIKEDLGIAVTFSVAKSHYNEYQGVFDRIIETLRVFRDKSKTSDQYTAKGARGSLLGESGIYDPDANNLDIQKQKQGRRSTSAAAEAGSYLIMLLILGGVGYYLYSKKKKKKKNK